MITNTFVLDERFPDCTLTTYIHEPYEELAITTRRAIIVCPGGGYWFLSDRESEPVALQYFAAGMNVFILRYSCRELAADCRPLREAALAMKHVRDRAADYHIDPAYVFITGFSAGGHCAASLCTMWKDDAVQAVIGQEDTSVCRPTGGVLCYPVITGGKYAHRGSIDNLCGGPSEGTEGAARWSLELRVEADTCPAFIWHTADDTCVPIQNSLLYASALAEHNIPFEYHVYPTGTHGLSLCNTETWSRVPALLNPVAAAWIRDAIRWCMEFKA